jgi:hypothetical protein
VSDCKEEETWITLVIMLIGVMIIVGMSRKSSEPSKCGSHMDADP